MWGIKQERATKMCERDKEWEKETERDRESMKNQHGKDRKSDLGDRKNKL